MKYKMIVALIACCFIGSYGMSAFAADDNESNDVNTVVGACMVQKFTEKKPPISESKLDECSNVDAKAAPKCLGLTDDEYNNIINFCVAQLNNAKCVSAKMKVPLIKYAGCGYEKDPVACFKGLGYTPDAVVKLSTDCQKEGTS